MGIREFFRLPPKHRRARKQVQGEVNPIKGSKIDLATPPHSEPNLRVGSSTLPKSALSISKTHGSNGMRTATFRVIRLTITPRNADDIVSCPAQPAVGPRQAERLELSSHTVKPIVTDEAKPNWKSTAYVTTKLAINIVRDSSDAFPPLKSVVGGLSSILKQCDVWLVSPL